MGHESGNDRIKDFPEDLKEPLFKTVQSIDTAGGVVKEIKVQSGSLETIVSLLVKERPEGTTIRIVTERGNPSKG